MTRDDIHDAYEQACRECGLRVDYLIFDNDPPGPDFRVVYYDDLSFTTLQKLSEAFDTRDINLSYDDGTGSDPCQDQTIVFKNAHHPK